MNGLIGFAAQRIASGFLSSWNYPLGCALICRRWAQSSETERQKQLMAKGLPKKAKLPGVDHVIVVASGKGGVGKSTTAVNLAVSLASKSVHYAEEKPGPEEMSRRRRPLKVGLLDCDVYGPSIPVMMNLRGVQPDTEGADGRLIPLSNYGVKCMSMGFLLEKEDSALAWRGPMVIAAVRKLSQGTNWSGLDVLVVDTPPGTGDIHLSLVQTLNISGVVVVTTPQEVALKAAVKAVTLFRTVGIPLIGLVENMSAFACPSCGSQTQIFGGGGRESLKGFAGGGVPYLGGVPLEPEVMRTSDEGTPIVLSNPASASAQCYAEISDKVLDFLQKS